MEEQHARVGDDSAVGSPDRPRAQQVDAREIRTSPCKAPNAASVLNWAVIRVQCRYGVRCKKPPRTAAHRGAGG